MKTNFSLPNINIGKDELGNDLVLNISNLKHLLITGVSESGKSNLLSKIISTLCLETSPDEVKLILADTKKIQLSPFDKIHHLLTPILDDSKKAILAMRWLNKEAERRLDTFKTEKIQTMEEYHQKKRNGPLPYIIYIVDGFSDIMSQYPKEIESAINNVAKIGHLVGIHLILSTTHVNNKIINQNIRTNIPSRLTFKLGGTAESRIVLEKTGAEDLQIPGEILFKSYKMKFPICAQLSCISNKEIHELVKSAKNSDNYKYTQLSKFDVEDEDSEDELYPTVRELVISEKKASTSYIQRKFGIGYSRAAKLVDMLEDNGVIGPANGSEAREVLGGKN